MTAKKQVQKETQVKPVASKVKNGVIFMAREPLRKLINISLPVAVAYKVAKLTQKFNEQLTAIEVVRNELIKKYGEKDKAGQMRVPTDSPNFAKFQEEFNTLMEIENDIAVEKIVLPANVDGHPLNIEPSVLLALEGFIEFKE